MTVWSTFVYHQYVITLEYATENWIVVVMTPILHNHHPLHWRHNDHDGVSNNQPRGCLLNRLFRRRSKKTSKLRVTGLCVGNSPGPVNSPHKGQLRGKGFHLMTSSWLSHSSMPPTFYDTFFRERGRSWQFPQLYWSQGPHCAAMVLFARVSFQGFLGLLP